MPPKSLLLYLCFLSAVSVCGQSPLGRWYGKLNDEEKDIHYLLDLRENGSQYRGLFDLPTDEIFRVGMDSLFLEQDGNAYIAHGGLGIEFRGEHQSSEEQIRGELTRDSVTFPIVFYREPQVIRTQKILTPLPYDSREIVFYNRDSIPFAGTLTTPRKVDKYPVVVLISGSGPQNRDEEILGHRPFGILADYLTRNGIGVLRYDDRGYGASGGRFRPATTMDYAEDAAAAVRYLKASQDPKMSGIGLAGHSEGGNIAPVVATQEEGIDFIILLAAPGLSNYASYLVSLDLILKEYPETYERDFPFFSSVYHDMATISDKEILRDSLTRKFQRISKQMEPEEFVIYGGVEPYVTSQVNQHTTDWYHHYLQFDVTPYLQKLTIPILALNGDQDISVEAEANLGGLEKTLGATGHPDYTLVTLNNVNHFFQTSKDDRIESVYFNEETFAQEALEIIAAWIQERS